MSAVIAFEKRLRRAAEGAPDGAEEALGRLHRAHRAEPYPSLKTRLAWLDRLHHLLITRKEDFARAISEDFGHRSRHETLIAEVFLALEAIRESRKRLPAWMRPETRRVGLPFLPARSRVERQPLGVVGIISPWNYPLQLAALPLVGALGAGNRVMLKPSELTPRTSALLAETLPTALGNDVVAVVTGDAKVGARFAGLPFDHLLFTGSTHVGRLVMQAAAPNLTPVTLELGGKSPAIVHRDYPLHHAAERIAAGKFFNAGQTCIAPDYLLAPAERAEAFAQAIADAVARSYPTLAENRDYTAIVNARHRARLEGYLEDARRKGARVRELNPAGEDLSGGAGKLAPHLVLDATEDMVVMQEEIFGPILPIVPYETLDDAIDFVNDRPRPLALYYFDRDHRRVSDLSRRTTSGGVTVNDTMFHVAQDDLPFGGVGPSGMGAYHGEAGFRTFSHEKAIFLQSRLNGAALLSPPYGKTVDRLLSLFLR